MIDPAYHNNFVYDRPSLLVYNNMIGPRDLAQIGYDTFLRSDLFHRYQTVRFVYHGKTRSWPTTLETKNLFIGRTASHICGQKRSGRWQRWVSGFCLLTMHYLIYIKHYCHLIMTINFLKLELCFLLYSFKNSLCLMWTHFRCTCLRDIKGIPSMIILILQPYSTSWAIVNISASLLKTSQ